jgi:hypothetical protein
MHLELRELQCQNILRYGNVWNKKTNNHLFLRYIHLNGNSYTDLTLKKENSATNSTPIMSVLQGRNYWEILVITKIMSLAYFVELHYPVLDIESKVIVTVIITLMTPKLSCVFLYYKGTCQSTWQI